MLHTKAQDHQPIGCGDFHIWAWWPSWSCDKDHLYKTFVPPPKESNILLEFKWPSGFRADMLKDGEQIDTGVVGIQFVHS